MKLVTFTSPSIMFNQSTRISGFLLGRRLTKSWSLVTHEEDLIAVENNNYSYEIIYNEIISYQFFHIFTCARVSLSVL